MSGHETRAPSTRARRRRRILAGVILTAGVGAAALTLAPGATQAALRLIERPAAPEAVASEPVRGLRVQVARLSRHVEERSYTGTVVARYETPVAFRVGGEIVSRAVEVGQAVRRGDVLLELDPGDHDQAVRAAEAALASARSQAAQATAEEARQARLLEEGWVAQAAYDRARAASDAAVQAVRGAEADLELARNDRGYARLVSPEDGIVTALAAEAGQVVAAGQPVVTLVRPGSWEAEVGIPEGQVQDLAGWTAEARLWSAPDAWAPASLREVAPQADPAGRTHRARFALAAPADLGATVTVRLARRSAAPLAELPATALLFRDEAPMVWVMAEGGTRVRALPVTVETLGADTARLGGVPEGARVVTLGVHRLDEGLPVRVLEEIDPEARP